MNTELLSRFGGLAVGCIIIMGLIVLACLVTPKLAKWIEKKNPALAEKIEQRGVAPERVDDAATGHSPHEYEAHSAFEASKEDGFDPNYKIYNEDIYALNLGRKKKNAEAPQEESGDEDK